jgi:4-amino-4-deoxy-L-arabinose transferase-like glycosyltransferase
MTTTAQTRIENPIPQRHFYAWEGIALAGLLIVHFFLLIYNLQRYSFYVDEAGYWRKASKPVGEMLAALAVDNIPPLYFFLLKGWSHLFGTSEIALRSLSVVFALANVVVLFLFVRRFWTRSLAFLVTLLFVLSPFNVFCARVVKYFSLFTLLTLLVHYFFFSLLERGGQKSPARIGGAAVSYVVAAICLIYTHYLGFVILLVLGFIYFISRSRTKVSARRWVHMHAIIVLSYLPWLIPFIKRLGVTASASAEALPPPGSFLLALLLRIVYTFYAFCFGHTVEPWHIVLVAASGFVFVFLFTRGIIAIQRNRRDDFSSYVAVVFVGNLIFAALVLSFFLSRLHFAFFSERVVFLLPFFLLIIAKGLRGLRRTAVACVAAIILVNAFSLFNLLTARENNIWSYLIPWKEISRSIELPAAHRQLILFDNYHLGSTGLYYLSNSGDFREIWDEPHEAIAVDVETDIQRFQRVCFIRSARDVTESKTLASIEAILKTHFQYVEEKDFVRESEALYRLKAVLGRGKRAPFEYKLRVLVFSAAQH